MKTMNAWLVNMQRDEGLGTEGMGKVAASARDWASMTSLALEAHAGTQWQCAWKAHTHTRSHAPTLVHTNMQTECMRPLHWLLRCSLCSMRNAYKHANGMHAATALASVLLLVLHAQEA